MDFTFSKLRNTIANFIDPNQNKFNQAFLWGVGGGYTSYDPLGLTYLEKGYKVNPIVYAVINQMATKTSSIPYYIRKIDDEISLAKMRRLEKATNLNMSPQQRVRHILLKTMALSKTEMVLPIEAPNPNQTWTEFMALYKTFLKLTGNVYFYSLMPKDGPQKGEPKAIYILPSHLTQIIIKEKADFLGIEDPIKGYILTHGRSFIEFEAENVIHIKYPNPEYGDNGEHLYGVSPLRAALKNIQDSNSGLDLNIRTLKSGGAFGFLHGKQTPVTVDQAAELKQRLIEMNNDPADLGKIAGISAEMGFTRISLTSDELKPFDYLSFDQKQICNVLNWSDKLLNNDAGAKYDNVSEYRKQVVTDNIVPDLKLFTDAMNKHWLPKFKGYENVVLEFDVMELPEMQVDISGLVSWLNIALSAGVVTRNEYRMAINYAKVDDNEDMDRFTVTSDIISLEESLDNDFQVPEPQGGQKIVSNNAQIEWTKMLLEAKQNAKM